MNSMDYLKMFQEYSLGSKELHTLPWHRVLLHGRTSDCEISLKHLNTLLSVLRQLRMVPERETGTCRSCLHLQMYKAPPAITPGLHIVMELTQFNFHSKEIFQYLFLAFRFVEDPLEWEFFWGSMQTGVHTYTFHILF